jgi:molecular chaperone DnaK (HSP70)
MCNDCANYYVSNVFLLAESFYTIHDNQETMTIDVYEGERSRVKDNHLLGLFELTDIPKAARGDVEVRITYKVDANGMLEVTAALVGGNNAKTVVIQPESGRLSQQDIDRMVEEAERFAEEDEKARERIELRNTLESLAYDLTGKLETIESNEQVSASEKKLLADAIDDAMHLLDNGKDASAADFKAKHSELQAISTPILRKANAVDADDGTDRNDMDDEL